MITLSIILAALLFAVGGIAGFVCWIVLLVRGFRESLLWGCSILICPVLGLVFMLLFRERAFWSCGLLMLPVAGLLFMLVYWDENKKLFVANLAAAAFLLIAWLIVQGPAGLSFAEHNATVSSRARHAAAFPSPKSRVSRETARPIPVLTASASPAAATAIATTATAGTAGVATAASPTPIAASTPTPPPPDIAVNEIEKAIAQKRIELKELYDALDVWARRLVTKRTQLKQSGPADVHAFNEEYAGYEAALRDYKNQSYQVELMEVDRLGAIKKAKKTAEESGTAEAK